jgi:hypothetical protein
VDALGTVVWQRSFGSAGDEFAKDVELTTDGNIIIAAESQKGPEDKDVFVKVVSQSGAPLDSVRFDKLFKQLDGQESDEEVNSISIIQNGYIVSGSTTAVKTKKTNDLRDALHIRLNNALDQVDPATGLWKNTSGLDDSNDVLIKMFEISSSTYYGFGYTNTIRNSSRDYKYWAFSLGATGDPTNNGTELLDEIGSPAEDEKLSGVIESPVQSGEGFVLSGTRSDLAGENKSFIVKLQKKLFIPGEDNVLAEETPTELGNFGTLNNLNEQMVKNAKMGSLSQGGFLLLTNNRLNSNNEFNISLIRLSNTFSREGREPIFFGGVGDDFAGTVNELPDGKIIVVGTMTLGGVTGQTKMVLMKLNASGRLND